MTAKTAISIFIKFNKTLESIPFLTEVNHDNNGMMSIMQVQNQIMMSRYHIVQNNNNVHKTL